MIYLLLGSDDFTKKEFVAQSQATEKAEQLSFFDFSKPKEALTEIFNTALNANLFGGKKVLKIYDFFASGAAAEQPEEIIEKLSKSSNTIFFIEQKLDKRKNETKVLLANKNLKVVEFNLPQGPEFKSWVLDRAKKYNLNFGKSALDLFIERVGTDEGGFDGAVYDLWQADSELKKLSTFAESKEITEDQVRDLVSENIDDNVFKITNAIGDKNKDLATKYLMDYMDRLAGMDEKAKIIGLSGLLSDQFRGILLMQGLIAANASAQEITEATGFSSGRVFVFKKLATRFTMQKVLDALKKLEHLDLEIKTSQGPAALQFFMIIESVMK